MNKITKTITPQMIEIGYSQLPQFRKDIEKVVKKFVKEVYAHDDGFGIADIIMEKIMDKFPDDEVLLNEVLLNESTACATYEYLFKCFDGPQELIAIHDFELSPSSVHYSDAYIRIMVKGKKIWIENWIVCDDLEDITSAYCYNISIGLNNEQREKIYNKNIINVYNVNTRQYSFSEELCD
jgi:hypothetical protein